MGTQYCGLVLSCRYALLKRSGYQRKLLKLRSLTKPLVKYFIADGTSTFSMASGTGTLQDLYWTTLVSIWLKSLVFPSMLKYFPLSTMIYHLWTQSFSPNPQISDNVIWTTPLLLYIMLLALGVLRCLTILLVWLRKNTHRLSFVFWMAIRSKLKNRNRLMDWAVINDLPCLPCHQQSEYVPHLFFYCSFLKAVKLCSSHALSPLPYILQLEVSRATGIICGKDFHKVIGRLPCSATAYFIWQERNSSIFKGIHKSP